MSGMHGTIHVYFALVVMSHQGGSSPISVLVKSGVKVGFLIDLELFPFSCIRHNLVRGLQRLLKGIGLAMLIGIRLARSTNK